MKRYVRRGRQGRFAPVQICHVSCYRFALPGWKTRAAKRARRFSQTEIDQGLMDALAEREERLWDSPYFGGAV